MPYVYPCAPWGAFSVQLGTGFLDDGYETATGDLHTGADVNARTGGDSDLGKPVHCITDGVVVYAGWDSWIGGIAIVHHPGPGVWSCYWHLQRKLSVEMGETLKAGALLGKIGKGGKNQFKAHLHYEIRLHPPAILKPDAWPSAMYRRKNKRGRVISYDRDGAMAFVKANYVDPIKFLEKNGAMSLEELEEVA
jgi:murein DD-endopeptidase MepM/ murein hydrolase activator NlpD